MGYFRILAGHNSLGIEMEVAWATPGELYVAIISSRDEHLIHLIIPLTHTFQFYPAVPPLIMPVSRTDQIVFSSKSTLIPPPILLL
jgi:hypothetical protein